MSCSHPAGEQCELCAGTLSSEDGATMLRSGGGSVSTTLPPGTQIGRYLVVDRLGEGGMGVVYKAHDPQLERTVALKLLRAAADPGADQSAAQARLLREAQAMAQLAHPNVVQIYDSGPYGQGVFIVMELVRGQTLDRWAKVAPRGWREVLDLYLQAGRGLLAAHEAGLVHRDFKPANVLVGADGRPRVTDFGLARADDAVERPDDDSEVTRSGPISLEVPLTQVGAMMGTPGYMAPEQYAGEQTSAATDQFAFCVSLYEALYGELPFQAPNLVELEAVTRKGVVPPPPKGPKVPSWLREHVLRGLSPRPERRHASMAQLLAALERDPAVARRRWLVAAGVAALLVGGASAAAWSTTQAGRACRGGEEQLAGTWDAPTREAVSAAFTKTGLPFAPRAFELVSATLDRWSDDWVAARTEACLATRARGEQTERQLVLRMACLDQRREEVASFTAALTRANQDLVVSAGDAVLRLTSLSACANLRQLEDRRQPPPELAGLAADLERQLARARGAVLAGELAAAEPALTQIAERARKDKLQAIEAASAEALAGLLVQQRKYPEARAQLELALRGAMATGDDEAGARVLATLVSLVGWRLEKEQEARTWASLAEGLIERLGGHGDLAARVAEGLGDTEWQARRLPAALEAYRRSFEGYRAATGEDTLDAARLSSSIGWVQIELGMLDEAERSLERSRAIRERLLGAANPMLATTWNELSLLASERRDFQRALDCMERATELAAPLGQSEGQRAWALSNVAVALSMVGRGDEALARLDQLARSLEPRDVPQYAEQMLRARIYALTSLGRLEEAVTLARAEFAEAMRATGAASRRTIGIAGLLVKPALALGLVREAAEAADCAAAELAKRDRFSPYAGAQLLEAAEAAEATGKLDLALKRAEPGLEALLRGVPDRLAFAQGRFIVGRLLARTPARSAEAPAMLALALEDARAAGDAALAARIEQWRAP